MYHLLGIIMSLPLGRIPSGASALNLGISAQYSKLDFTILYSYLK